MFSFDSILTGFYGILPENMKTSYIYIHLICFIISGYLIFKYVRSKKTIKGENSLDELMYSIFFASINILIVAITYFISIIIADPALSIYYLIINDYKPLGVIWATILHRYIIFIFYFIFPFYLGRSTFFKIISEIYKLLYPKARKIIYLFLFSLAVVFTAATIILGCAQLYYIIKMIVIKDLYGIKVYIFQLFQTGIISTLLFFFWRNRFRKKRIFPKL